MLLQALDAAKTFCGHMLVIRAYRDYAIIFYLDFKSAEGLTNSAKGMFGSLHVYLNWVRKLYQSRPGKTIPASFLTSSINFIKSRLKLKGRTGLSILPASRHSIT